METGVHTTVSGTSQNSTGVREFHLPLKGAVASIKVPFPMTKANFDLLLTIIKGYEAGLVHEPGDAEN